MIDGFWSKIDGTILHVGANWGQERDFYDQLGLHVLWVEAIPSVFEKLKAHIAKTPKQLALLGLVTEKSGERYSFHVSSNGGESSSIYDLALHKDIWPEVHYTHDIELKSTTLDDLLADNAIDIASIQALVMDTQGSELLVLKGSSRLINQVRFIKTEAADFESYKGCTKVDELVAYLAPCGFYLVGKELRASREKGGDYYELLFERQNYLNQTYSAEGLVDVALGKPATQSSISEWSLSSDEAANAVSGRTFSDYAFHTGEEDNPWWSVDLGASFPIETIVVHNRVGMMQERARRLRVEIGETEGGPWTLVHAGYSAFGGGGNDYPLVLRTGGLLSGRHVRLSLDERQTFHLSKVEVFVQTNVAPPSDSKTDVATDATVIEALSLLTPYDINRNKERLGPLKDGGYVLVPELLDRNTVFSYGIDGEYQLDLLLASRGHKIMMFDHTISGIDNPNNDPNLNFIKEGVDGVKDELKHLNTIENHLSMYGGNDRNIILKMDVEEYEYAALDVLSEVCIRRFQQIVFEAHSLHNLGDVEFRRRFVRVFSKLNKYFTLYHVHANNFDGESTYTFLSGVPVPNLIELSFVRSDLIQRRPSQTLYPTPIDCPNVHPEDKRLWFFPFLPSVIPTQTFADADRRMADVAARIRAT
jgi:FkbM family methyltransferase